MKKMLFTLLSCISLFAYGRNATYEKLTEVNKCWKEQKDISASLLPEYHNLSEREWIRTHLSLVETTLRNRNMSALSTGQRQNRIHCLDLLHTYWQTGNFPLNEDHTYRTPIFIDKHDNFCAVGYLVKATGNEHVSRMISAKTNLAYVRDMHYPELAAWAKENGFTTDELAWIQPGYPPNYACGKIGNGVNGTVYELFTDAATEKLYVGGSFTHANTTMPVNNIAYVTEAGGVYTWHSMGTGVNGRVNAIVKYDSKIFVGGSFNLAGGVPANNAAWWDGSSWHSAGCVSGTINDLIVFGGELYAAGSFYHCGSLTGANFAKWDGLTWQMIPGINGHINTMEVVGSKLVLGGDFSYGLSHVNAVQWTPSASFSIFTGPVNNEVMDFEVFQDSLYAVCKRTHTTDTASLFLKLRNNTWYSAFDYASTYDAFTSPHGTLSFNTLCGETTSLNMGGQFLFAPMMGTSGSNCYNIGSYGNWVTVDSEVNKMTFFKGELILGGKFKNGGSGGWGGGIEVNGITRRIGATTAVQPMSSIDHMLRIYPNPAQSSGKLTFENNFSATRYTIHHVTGKMLASGSLENNPQITLPHLPSGAYIITLSNDEGDREIRKVQVVQ